jgi:DnaJ family protein C protein 3
LSPSNHDILLKLAAINYFSLYEPQGALGHVKKCLHYDPEQKECKKMFRRLKELDKSMEQNKFVAASKKLVGPEGVIVEVDEEVAKLEEILDAAGKMPRRLNIKLYNMACKIYGEVSIAVKSL